MLNTDRVFGSRIAAGGQFQDLTDGTIGAWSLGLPFRAFNDRRSFSLSGFAGDERVLQYRDGERFATFQRRSFIQRGSVAFAPLASARTYVRVGAAAQVRRQEYLADSLTAVVPDTGAAVVVPLNLFFSVETVAGVTTQQMYRCRAVMQRYIGPIAAGCQQWPAANSAP